MKPSFIIALCAAHAVAPCRAYDAQGNLAVWGVGQTSCFSYKKARTAGGFNDYKHYTLGYLTAYNALTPETYNVSGSTDLHGVLGWLDAHCKKKPMESFEQALKTMVTTMHRSRQTLPPGRPAAPVTAAPPKAP